jgi:hypothetical protein
MRWKELKIINRFQYLESKAGELGKPLMDMTLEMDVFGKKEGLPKNRNWKISDFQIIQIWEEGSDSKKIGIGKSLIFKSFKFGRSSLLKQELKNL